MTCIIFKSEKSLKYLPLTKVNDNYLHLLLQYPTHYKEDCDALCNY